MDSDFSNQLSVSQLGLLLNDAYQSGHCPKFWLTKFYCHLVPESAVTYLLKDLINDR